MLKSISSIVFLCFIFNLFGQKTEFDVSSNASLFSFSGNSVKNGSVTLNKSSNSVYANIPYGAKKGLGDGLSITLKRITKKHFIWGLDLGYESMKSREFINKSISPDVMGIPYIPVPATGKVFMKTNYFIFFPHIGKRIALKKMSLDIDAGIEFGLVNTSNESGMVNSSSDQYSIHSDMSHALINTDLRTRLQVGVNYYRYGGYFGYSWGQSDYGGGMGGGCSPGPGYTVDPTIYNKYFSRIIRFGISYKLF